jgi:rRNA maturation RNase YbeY
MPESIINYFMEEVKFQLEFPKKHNAWLMQVAKKEKFMIKNLNFVFCSDDYLLSINKQYLAHDYYTDIITFDQSEKDGIVTGDVFISIDRAYENANIFELDHITEVRRLLVHGLLHLVGYNDRTEGEKIVMTEKEDYYLSLWSKKN